MVKRREIGEKRKKQGNWEIGVRGSRWKGARISLPRLYSLESPLPRLYSLEFPLPRLYLLNFSLYPSFTRFMSTVTEASAEEKD